MFLNQRVHRLIAVLGFILVKMKKTGVRINVSLGTTGRNSCMMRGNKKVLTAVHLKHCRILFFHI